MTGPAWSQWLSLLERALGYVIESDDLPAAERAWRQGQMPTQYARQVTGRTA